MTATGALASILANRTYVAAGSLLIALLANWLLGTVDALVRRQFSWAAWPRILASQLASTELRVIYATYGGAIAAAIAAQFLGRGGVIDQSLMAFAVARLLDVASLASGLYSASLWRECASQVLDIGAALARGPAAVKRNLPRTA